MSKDFVKLVKQRQGSKSLISSSVPKK